ncbi:MAG TPA: 2-dehydropantoate 2-reductase N-terminal domain-containing protein, partial [Plasticicumulans sp.]|nr:2-dehydropantoate 2-reductase N-terminal domain-containing protein [Plasticicumulans sp.]
MATLAVLGAGSWGTALALLLARNGHAVRLWGHDPAQVARLATERENAAFLPGVTLPGRITPGADLAAACSGAAM